MPGLHSGQSAGLVLLALQLIDILITRDAANAHQLRRHGLLRRVEQMAGPGGPAGAVAVAGAVVGSPGGRAVRTRGGAASTTGYGAAAAAAAVAGGAGVAGAIAAGMGAGPGPGAGVGTTAMVREAEQVATAARATMALAAAAAATLVGLAGYRSPCDRMQSNPRHNGS